ncbi:MAG: hypothetical protein ACRDZ7_19435, partial [Acidimicrobiia bacterium]
MPRKTTRMFAGLLAGSLTLTGGLAAAGALVGSQTAILQVAQADDPAPEVSPTDPVPCDTGDTGDTGDSADAGDGTVTAPAEDGGTDPTPAPADTPADPDAPADPD